MKRLAALVLCLCLSTEAAASVSKTPRKRASVSATQKARHSPEPARPAGPWVVDIRELVPSLRPMPQKEREDQLRDWALYGLLMRLDLGAEELAATTHQLAPMRLPYLEELFAFDYGPGRRAILSDSRVLLVYEQNDPDPQATLGRLADRVRMETGRMPDSFELYTFSADVAGDELRLEFKEAVPGATLYSPAYGYSEAVVTGSEELGRWLDTVDDVVYVAQAPEGLKLGGRRFEKSRTRGARLEDVAALYQAHTSLAAQRRAQTQQLGELELAAQRELDRVLPEEVQQAFLKFPRDREAQKREVDQRMRAYAKRLMGSASASSRVPPEPGFSLDPQLNEPELVASLKELAEEPCRALAGLGLKAQASAKRLEATQAWPGSLFAAALVFRQDAPKLRALCQALARDSRYAPRLRQVATAARGLLSGDSQEEALAPLYALKNELADATDERDLFTWAALQLTWDTHRKQCARYDGPLGGTRVGMNLFYTDLLAKLWFLDVNHEAPGLRVPGFVSMGRLPPSPYREEDRQKANTRLWFGPKKEAFTRSPEDSELRFQHVATRVFAAGSNPDQLKGKEGTPNEHSRRAIGWWERHYADVADYEQEYHLQNQVMKWSIITGFFREKQLAPYLQQVPVVRTEQFGQWYERTRPELKYQLPLVVEGESSRECMDILATRSGLSGGVSLSGGKLSEVPVVKNSGPASLRHTLQSMGEGGSATEQLGRAFPTHVGPKVNRVEPLPTTRLRIEAVQLELGPVELVHVRTKPGAYELALQTDQAQMGRFYGTTSAGRTTLRWSPREVEEALGVVRKAGPNGEAVFVSVETVGASKQNPAHFWRAEVHGVEDRAVQIPLASGEGSAFVRLSGMAMPLSNEAATTGSLLTNYDWQRLSIAEGAAGLQTSQGVIRTAVNTGPSPGAVTVRVMDVEGFPNGLEVVVSENEGVYVPRPQGADGVKSWLNLDKSAALTPEDLVRIQKAAGRGETTIARAALSEPQAERAARALAGDDTAQFGSQFQKLSKKLGPEQARQEVRRHLEDAADYRLGKGDSREASRLYELARDHFGDAAPDALIEQTVAEVHAGKTGPGSLQEVLERHAAKLNLTERVRVVRAAQSLWEEMPDVLEVVQAKLDFQRSIPGEVVPRVQLERDGPDVVSTFQTEKPLNVDPVAPDEFKKGVPKDATIYVEDGTSFNKNDFQANPAASVAELEHNPEVEVLRIRQMETGGFRPGKVYTKAEQSSEERVYRRLAGPTSVEESTSAESTSPIYLIRWHPPVPQDPCDTDKDGTVSSEERRLCKAA